MRRARLAVLLLVLAMAGCGDGDDDVGESATVNGTVNGNSLVPVSAISGTTSPFIYVFTEVDTTFTAVAISDFQDECGNTNVIGNSLYFSLFQDPTQSNSVVTEPGTFAVWLPDLNGQGPVPTGNQVVLSFFHNTEEGGSGQTAASGSVTITRV